MEVDAQERIAALREERLRLERESLELERSRLAAARDRFERESRLGGRRPVRAVVVWTALASALAGFGFGMAVGAMGAGRRAQAARDAKLQAALSRLSSEGVDAQIMNFATNRPPVDAASPSAPETHRNVSVIVIE